MPIRLSSNRLDLGSANLTNAEMRGWSETVNALGNVTGATTIDLSLGNVITATTTGATTWTVTNTSSTQTSSFTLILTNGGSATQTWMSGTQWANGTSPTLNSSGTDVLTFFTTDAGTVWRASKGGPTPQDQTGAKLFVWGLNTYGQLGQGDTVSRSSPVQVGGQWRDVVLINGSTFGLKPNGSLYAWGTNSTGWLGLGDTVHRSSPVQIPGTWTHLFDGYRPTALKADGSLWIWSWDNSGGLGQGVTIDRSSPTQIAGTWKIAASARGGSMAVRHDGTLWAWGLNSYGMLGLSDTVRRSSPVQVSGTWSGAYSGGALLDMAMMRGDGSMWRSGKDNGTFGVGAPSNFSSPVQMAGTWKKVSSAAYYSTFIRHDGTLWSSGYNLHGALGLGDTIKRSSPVQIGSGLWTDISQNPHSSGHAVSSSGSLFSWGRNQLGQLGVGNTISRSSPVQVDGTWKSVNAGAGFVGGLRF